MNNITLFDLSMMRQIIDVCAKRGAFNPAEFKAVGDLSEKIDSVIDSYKNDATQPTDSPPADGPSDEQQLTFPNI